MAPDRAPEDLAPDLGRTLRAQGHRDLAATLPEVVPESGVAREHTDAVVRPTWDEGTTGPDAGTTPGTCPAGTNPAP